VLRKNGDNATDRGLRTDRSVGDSIARTVLIEAPGEADVPSYHEVMTTDLSTLTTAAQKWDDMAKSFFEHVEPRYKDDVHGISLGGPIWNGLSANAANARFDITLKEIQAAQKEAKAIASLLRDAHTDFVDLKKRVEQARDDAIKAGMRVTDQGVCHYDFSKVSQQEAFTIRHDPGLADTERSWTAHIAAAVKAVSDSDAGVKIALNAVVKDSDPLHGMPGGFNGGAKDDVEAYEEEAVRDIAKRVADGKDVSAKELEELQRALRDNHDDKAFSRLLLEDLGPKSTIELGKELNERISDAEGGEKLQLAEIEKNLANSVATATAVPGSVKDMPPGSDKFNAWLASKDGAFYKEWTDGMKKEGTKNFGPNTNPLYGYQAYVSLMQHASTDFDDQFLYDLGDQTIKAEKDHPGIFTMWGPGHKGVETDAVDGVLGLMSRNPDAATAFFDPDGNGKPPNHVGNNHLDYLLGSGDDAREWPKNTITGIHVTTLDDPTSRMGLGLALEAATTGHEPLREGESGGKPGPHTAEQARIMQQTINILDNGAGGESIHANLHKPLGHAIADYAQDNHHILAENGTKYGSPEGKDKIWQDGEDAGITVGKDSLMRVMRGVSSDDQTYALLQDTQRMYALDRLTQAPESGGSSNDAWKNPAHDLGAVTGAMNSIGSDVILDERDGKVGAANDMAKYAYHGIGAPITGLPILGDTAQRLVDAATYEWSKDVADAASSQAQEKNSDHYAAGINGTYDMIDRWAEDRGVDIHDEENKKNDPNWVAWQAMRDEAKLSYGASRGDAAVYLGWE
jgi:molecular chaperone GrpE (heat shock protein)